MTALSRSRYIWHSGRSMRSSFGIALPVFVVLAAWPVATLDPRLWLFHAGGIFLGGLVLSSDPKHARSFPIEVAIFAVLALLTHVAAASTAPLTSLIGGLRLLSYGLLFWLLLQSLSNLRRVRRAAIILFAGVGAQAIWALVAWDILPDIALLREKQAYFGFATGSFINRNALAAYLGLGLCLGLGVFLSQDTRSARRSMDRTLERCLVFAVLVLIVLALVATGSRLGLVSASLGVFTIFAFAEQNKGMRWWVMGVLGLASVPVVTSDTGAIVVSRFSGLESGFSDRQALWMDVLEMISERPLRGYGIDTFAYAFRPFQSGSLDAALVWDMPHSTVLTLLLSLGIGAALVILVYVRILARLARCAAFARTPVFVAVALGASVQASCHFLADFSMEIPANSLLLVSILALGVAATHNESVGP